MNIIAKGSITYYCDQFPKAKTALLSWYYEFSKQIFKSFNDLKGIYGNASIVANSRVVFNIKDNEYRLVVMVSFKKSAAYIIWFGTHSEYDKINVSTISFDTKILQNKN
jgi:mRNA interferase HigB